MMTTSRGGIQSSRRRSEDRRTAALISWQAQRAAAWHETPQYTQTPPL